MLILKALLELKTTKLCIQQQQKSQAENVMVVTKTMIRKTRLALGRMEYIH